jgi:hypothetical protein
MSEKVLIVTDSTDPTWVPWASDDSAFLILTLGLSPEAVRLTH